MQQQSGFEKTEMLLVSATGHGISTLPLSENPRISGLYHVCGRNPWLLLINPPNSWNPSDSIFNESLLSLGPLRVQFSSTSYAARFWPSHNTPFEPSDKQNHCFIFIRRAERPTNPAEFEAALNTIRQTILTFETRGTLEPRMLLCLDVSEWAFCLEGSYHSVEDLTIFLRTLADDGFDTTTKFVLVTWKDRGVFRTFASFNNDRRTNFDTTPYLPLDAKIATKVRNDVGFFNKNADPHQQARKLMLSESLATAQLRLRVPGPYCWKDQLKHPNPYVDRFTLRPVTSDWRIHWVFIRSKAGCWAQLRDHLIELIGVGETRIIPRVYHITGEFDFLIPVYKLRGFDPTLISQDLNLALISGFPVALVCSLPDPDGSQKDPFSLINRVSTEALLRNACNPEQFWSEFTKLNDQKAQGKNIRMLEANFSPRTVSAHLDLMNTSTSNEESIPHSTQDIGMNTTWELITGPGKAAFVRLYVKDPASLEALKAVIGQIKDRCEIQIDYFRRDYSELLGIARFVEVTQLERFLYKTRLYCARTEFHLILDCFFDRHSRLPSPKRCAPCTSPLDFTLNDPKKLDCSHCGRYVAAAPNLLDRKIRIDLFKGDQTKTWDSPPLVKIALVHLELTKEQLYEIGAIPSPLDSLSYTSSWRKASCGRDLAHSTMAILNELESADIVVFPEYCVPYHGLMEILQQINAQTVSVAQDRDRFIVLGSHVDDRGYNTCPIIHIRQLGKSIEVSVYQQQKTALTPIELPFIQRIGTARLVLRSDIGNLTFDVCRDAYDDATERDIDFQIVPAYHEGDWQSLPDQIENTARTARRVSVFANGAASKGRSPSFIARRGQVSKIDPENGNAIRFGQFAAWTMSKEIDLLELDCSRIQSKRGASLNGAFPLHVDRWPKKLREDNKDALDSRLENVLRYKPMGEPSSIGDFLAVEWQAAAYAWNRR